MNKNVSKNSRSYSQNKQLDKGEKKIFFHFCVRQGYKNVPTIWTSCTENRKLQQSYNYSELQATHSHFPPYIL